MGKRDPEILRWQESRRKKKKNEKNKREKGRNERKEGSEGVKNCNICFFNTQSRSRGKDEERQQKERKGV
jgi:hypothetical protein